MQIFNFLKAQEFANMYSDTVGDPKSALLDGRTRTGKMIRHLKALKHHDEFYTVYNLKEQKLTWHYGLDTYLGYTLEKDSDLQIDFFIDLIHPFIRQWVMAYIAGMNYCLFHKKLSKLEYLKTKYVTNLPIRKWNGTYMFVKQISMPFQFDENGMLVSYINSSFIVDKYKGESLKPRLFHMTEHLTDDEEVLLEATREFTTINESKNLQPSLWKIVEEILKLPQRNKSMIARRIKPGLTKKDQKGEYSEESINRYIL